MLLNKDKKNDNMTFQFQTILFNKDNKDNMTFREIFPDKI